MKSFNYIPREANIVAKKSLSNDTVGFSIRLKGAKPFTFLPGQFIMLSRLGFGSIPVGIASSPGEKQLDVAVRKVGEVTSGLASLEVGDTIGVAGPFGNGLSLSKLKSKDVVIVAGGLGIPPLRGFIKAIGENPKLVKSLTILIGAKTPGDLLYREDFRAWEGFATVYQTVDKAGANWTGETGLITKLFEKVRVKKGSAMLVCGPPQMFETIVKMFAGKRVPESDLYLFLERKMVCGVGKCQHCTCGKNYICLDGPVFPYAAIKYNDEAFK